MDYYYYFTLFYNNELFIAFIGASDLLIMNDE